MIIVTIITYVTLLTGLDLAVENATRPATDTQINTISGQSYIDCQAGDEHQCILSETYDLIAPLYIADLGESVLLGTTECLGVPHTEFRACHEALVYTKECESYGGYKYNGGVCDD